MTSLKDKAAAAKEQMSETSETPKSDGLAVRPAGPLAGKADFSVFITDPNMVATAMEAPYGTFPAVVASGGSHMISGQGVDLGKKLKFHVILTTPVWKITPGATDDEAKEYFKISYDNQLTTEGVPVEEAVADAKAAGYPRAACKAYLDITAMIVDCENEDYINEIVVLQLAPSSKRNWGPIEFRCKMKAATGELEAVPVSGGILGSAVIFTSVAKNTSYNGNNYTLFEFSV